MSVGFTTRPEVPFGASHGVARACPVSQQPFKLHGEASQGRPQAARRGSLDGPGSVTGTLVRERRPPLLDALPRCRVVVSMLGTCRPTSDPKKCPRRKGWVERKRHGTPTPGP